MPRRRPLHGVWPWKIRRLLLRWSSPARISPIFRPETITTKFPKVPTSLPVPIPLPMSYWLLRVPKFPHWWPEPRSYVPKESKYVLFQLRPKGFSVCKARNIKRALFLRAQKYSDLPPDCPLRSKGWWVPTVKYSDSNRLVSLPLIRSLMRNWDLRHKMFMTK